MKQLIIICSILLATSSCYFYPYSANEKKNNIVQSPKRWCTTLCEEHCPTFKSTEKVYYTCEYCGQDAFSHTHMRICDVCAFHLKKCQKCLANWSIAH